MVRDVRARVQRRRLGYKAYEKKLRWLQLLQDFNYTVTSTWTNNEDNREFFSRGDPENHGFEKNSSTAKRERERERKRERGTPCVGSKRLRHVFSMRAFCRYTRRRFEPTHGDVWNLHTGCSACQAAPHTTHTTHRTQNTPRTHIIDNAHHTLHTNTSTNTSTNTTHNDTAQHTTTPKQKTHIPHTLSTYTTPYTPTHTPTHTPTDTQHTRHHHAQSTHTPHCTHTPPPHTPQHTHCTHTNAWTRSRRATDCDFETKK